NVNWDWRPPLKPKLAQFPMAYQEAHLPPKEYDHDYDGELTVRYMTPQALYQQCIAAVRPGQGKPLACTRSFQGAPKHCLIYIIPKETLENMGWSYDIVMRHELGHCNGWHHSY